MTEEIIVETGEDSAEEIQPVGSPPTVGRIVHYVSHGSADGRYPKTCRAAVVTEVSAGRADPEQIGLAVLNPTGIFFDRQSGHSEGVHRGGTWHWPCVRTGEEQE